MRALEDCRAALEGRAGPIGAIGDGFENRQVDAAIFGELDAADGLAAAVNELDTSGKEQFDAAEGLLRSAGGALDAVRDSTTENDATIADSMRA